MERLKNQVFNHSNRKGTEQKQNDFQKPIRLRYNILKKNQNTRGGKKWNDLKIKLFTIIKRTKRKQNDFQKPVTFHVPQETFTAQPPITLVSTYMDIGDIKKGWSIRKVDNYKSLMEACNLTPNPVVFGTSEKFAQHFHTIRGKVLKNRTKITLVDREKL